MLQRMLCEGDGEEQCKISTAALAAFNQMQHCMGEERGSPSGTACYAQQGCSAGLLSRAAQQGCGQL